MTQSIRVFEGQIASGRSLFSWKLVAVPIAGLVGFCSLFLGVWILFSPRPDAASDVATAPAATVAALEDLSNPYGAPLVDLRSRLRAQSALLSEGASLDTAEASVSPPPALEAEQGLRPSLAPAPEEPKLVEAPLPPHRPDGLKTLAGAPPQQPAPPRIAHTDGQTVATAAPADGRGFFDKFFGSGPTAATPAPSPQQPPRTAVAYAATPDAGGLFSALRGNITAAPAPRVDNQTAVYDISAHTVYLPNGTRLEAHSGLGNRLDDPRFVHERMRGATPPAVYELTPREKLFHGVAALRLTPISGTVYGRAGLLAHTYMLGPNGDSNGCVSFRDYHAFLRAYQNGEIKRLAVVTHAN